MIPMSADFTPTLRRILHELTEGGQSRLVQARLLLSQHLLAIEVARIWLCSIFHHSGRANRPATPGLKLILNRTVQELIRRGKEPAFAHTAAMST